jgi:hypothetical protein
MAETCLKFITTLHGQLCGVPKSEGEPQKRAARMLRSVGKRFPNWESVTKGTVVMKILKISQDLNEIQLSKGLTLVTTLMLHCLHNKRGIGPRGTM